MCDKMILESFPLTIAMVKDAPTGMAYYNVHHHALTRDDGSYSWFAHDVISCHWAPSWLTLQITSAVCSEVLVSIYYLIVSFSVL